MSGFISPEGQFYECPFEGHEDWAGNHIVLIIDKIDRNSGEGNLQPYVWKFLRAGWIRLSMYSFNIGDFSTEKINLVKKFIIRSVRSDSFDLPHYFSVYSETRFVGDVPITATGRPDFSDLDAFSESDRSRTHRYRG